MSASAATRWHWPASWRWRSTCTTAGPPPMRRARTRCWAGWPYRGGDRGGRTDLAWHRALVRRRGSARVGTGPRRRCLGGDGRLPRPPPVGGETIGVMSDPQAETTLYDLVGGE